MTEARSEVNSRCESVTRKPVLLWVYYFITLDRSQVKCGRLDRFAQEIHEVHSVLRVEFIRAGLPIYTTG